MGRREAFVYFYGHCEVFLNKKFSLWSDRLPEVYPLVSFGGVQYLLPPCKTQILINVGLPFSPHSKPVLRDTCAFYARALLAYMTVRRWLGRIG